jgi:hypothetical protein
MFSALSDLEKCELGGYEHIFHKRSQSKCFLRLMPHLFETGFLDGNDVLKSFYRIPGNPPRLGIRLRCVSQETTLRGKQVVPSLVLRCSWKACHRSTAFLTSGGGRGLRGGRRQMWADCINNPMGKTKICLSAAAYNVVRLWDDDPDLKRSMAGRCWAYPAANSGACGRIR